MQPTKKIPQSVAMLMVIAMIAIATTAVAISQPEETPVVSDATPVVEQKDTVVEVTSPADDEVVPEPAPEPTAPVAPMPAPAPVTAPAPAPAPMDYRNGTYQTTVTYYSPGGYDKIGVTVTVADDVVASTSLTQHPTSGDSAHHISNFAAVYKSRVVGKDIDTVSLTTLAGASLTTQAFNDAIEQIKRDAAI